MLGIIGAMEVEVETLKLLIKDKKEEQVSGVNFISGKLGNEDVVVAKCGVGKVFAAICAEAMILTYQPDMIINVGVAGSLDTSLNIGDVVIAKSVVQHDMDTTPIGDPYGMLSDIKLIHIPTDEKFTAKLEDAVKSVGIPYKIGIVASGDQFIDKPEQKSFIKDHFNANACEMEGGSIGHVCYVNNIPFAVLRAISDGANEDSKMDFPTFTKLAAENTVKVIKKLVSLSEE